MQQIAAPVPRAFFFAAAVYRFFTRPHVALFYPMRPHSTPCGPMRPHAARTMRPYSTPCDPMHRGFPFRPQLGVGPISGDWGLKVPLPWVTPPVCPSRRSARALVLVCTSDRPGVSRLNSASSVQHSHPRVVNMWVYGQVDTAWGAPSLAHGLNPLRSLSTSMDWLCCLELWAQKCDRYWISIRNPTYTSTAVLHCRTAVLSTRCFSYLNLAAEHFSRRVARLGRTYMRTFLSPWIERISAARFLRFGVWSFETARSAPTD
jgi:hypothetical protein